MIENNGFIEHVLENGLRVVIEVMPGVGSAAGGFLVRTGARDERPELAGVSHFVEHMCFKGTAKRDWRQVTLDFDNMGSTYNAYTSRERTVYFGWVRSEDLPRQLELLADMMRSRMPAEEFETEKKVILEEIAMAEDQLDSRLYELLHEKLFAGHPLAWPVLGTQNTITALTREQLWAYFEERYNPANVVLVVAGTVEPRRVIDLAHSLCGGWRRSTARPERTPPRATFGGSTSVRVERFAQQAVAFASPAPSAQDPDREHGDVLGSIIGGNNSRYFWNIVQEGIAPQVAAGRVDYADCGMMLSFGFCEPLRTEELAAAMRRELREVARAGVREEEVQRVKNRVRTTLATEAEAPYYRLMQMLSDIDQFGSPRSVSRRLAAIDAVTAEGIREYLHRWPIDGPTLTVSLGPREAAIGSEDGEPGR